MKRKTGQFVVPGDRLGVIEEFIPSSGAYVDLGTIHSKASGYMLLDLLNKTVSVYPLIREAVVPRVGSVVVGQVLDTQSRTATIRIFKVGKKALSGFFTGILHISDVSSYYVDEMSEVCKPGDVMRAKVFSNMNRTYHLETVDEDFGIVYALCSRCGGVLLLKNEKLECLDCGKREKRKTATDYGKVEICEK